MTFVHAIVTCRTLHFTWLLCESDRYIAPYIPLCHHLTYEYELCSLMYATLSETSSSPDSPIVPVPSSPEPKEVGANSTGKELPSVWWTAMVLCVCVCVRTCAYMCLSVGLHGVPHVQGSSREKYC